MFAKTGVLMNPFGVCDKICHYVPVHISVNSMTDWYSSSPL